MNAPNNHDWQPHPHLLAAYFDGELKDVDPDAHAQVSAWIERHPEARTQGAKDEALRRLWLDTTPIEPDPALWDRMHERLKAERRKPRPLREPRRSWGARIAVAASIAILIGSVLGVARLAFPPGEKTPAVAIAPPRQGMPADNEVFPVASSDEVVVTYIEGADTKAIAVGQLPVQGPLEIADVGEVHFVAIRSDAQPSLRPQVQQNGPRRPMIWMPRESD